MIVCPSIDRAQCRCSLRAPLMASLLTLFILLLPGTGGEALGQSAQTSATPTSGPKPPERTERMDSALGEDQRTGLIDPRIALGGRRLPGPQLDGTVLLHNQWSLRPAGNQLELGDFPVNIAMHPSKDFAAVLCAGQSTHEVIIVDTKDREIVCRSVIPQGFFGVTFDRAGSRVFASGAEYEIVHAFDFQDGQLGTHTEIPIVDPKSEFVPAGMTTSFDDKTLYVCGSWGDKLAIVDIDRTRTTTNSQRQFVDLPKDSFPYVPLLSSDGKTLYVSLWGASSIAVIDLQSLSVRATWKTPSHPTEMVLTPDNATLFVACSNSNQVADIDTATGETRQLISVSLHPNSPPGSAPQSLALSPDAKTLYVASANNNAVAVVDVATPGEAESEGFIPTGWYPTGVRAYGDGIFYLSGRGLSPKSNRFGPRPGVKVNEGVREYIAGLYKGSLGYVRKISESSLKKLTADAVNSAPLRSDFTALGSPERGNPVPAKLGDPSPIKYCIYVIKENRTYDQVFGDMPEGNGDASLCLFGEDVTPNQHALSREFVLLDNFYVNAEVSANGHEWTMGAYCTDFVENVWRLTYRKQAPNRKLTYPAEGAFDAATPAGGYLWDKCFEAGVTFRTYGEWVRREKDGQLKPNAKALEGHFDPEYEPYNLEYPDVKRAERFLAELKRYELAGDMPRMQVVRLGNDHTMGTRRDKPTPRAMVAENDLAVGTLIEGLSKSKFWAQTAVFVLEDDAQNGSDHVDAHRSTALVISPYSRSRGVDSTMYSTCSMLRTMGLILGTKPMSQYDASAMPMFNCFNIKPDTTPYTLRPARIDINEKNQQAAWGAQVSEDMDFAEADAADDLLLNEIVWRSVKGPDSAMPAPVRATFFFARRELDDD